MAETVSGFTFSARVVNLDGAIFEKCEFRNCTLIYSGGDLPQMSDCQIQDCEWRFEGAAGKTINFMKGIYHGLGPPGQEIIEATFRSIKEL